MTQKKMTDYPSNMNESNTSEDIVEIFQDSNNYPFILKSIKKPPNPLYAIGNIELLNKQAVAIVGTRDPSKIGRLVTSQITKYYANNDFVIVSGLALGIDAIAMEVALSRGGPIIGVLPSSLDNIVPKKNKKLAKLIIKNGGLLISERPKGSRVYKSSYVERNRIISGISTAIIIVESSINGGTMHTYKFAKEQIRPVIVADLEAEGNQMLIKEGTPSFQYKPSLNKI